MVTVLRNNLLLLLIFFLIHHGVVALEARVADAPGLEITVIEPKAKTFNRGEHIKFLVQVKDAEKNDVRKASVSVAVLQKKGVDLEETGQGIYSASLLVSPGAQLGAQPYTIVATKDIGGVAFSGHIEGQLVIEKAGIGIQVISPTEKIFRSGDTMAIVFTASYKSGEKLLNPVIDVNIAGKKIPLTEKEKGVFEGGFKIPFEFSGMAVLDFSVTDAFGNTASKQVFLEIEKENIIAYVLKTDLLLPIAAIIIASGAVFSLVLKTKKKFRTEELKNRRKLLLNSIAEIQKLYYKDNKLEKQEYQKLLEGYSAELEKIDSVLEKNKNK